jgi:hypothetical protein
VTHRRVLYVGVPSLLAAAGLICFAPGQASATQSVRHTTNAYYIESASASSIESLGTTAGNSDQDNNYHDRTTILDFGGQESSGDGAVLISNTDVTNSQIEALAKDYATSYVNAADGATVFNNIAIGTNNSIADALTAANGTTWGTIVNSLNTWATDQGIDDAVYFDGADDMEPSFGGTNSAPNTVSWVLAFDSEASATFLWDYGSADGCSETAHDDESCNNGWDQQTEYRVSYEANNDLGLPEIYVSGQQQEWLQIDLYGYDYKSGDYIDGPISQHDLDGSSYTSTQAWDNLSDELNSNSTTAEDFDVNETLEDEG